MGDLPEEEQPLYSSSASEFLREPGNTAMPRVYKMPVLYAFLDGDVIRQQADTTRLLKTFFAENTSWRDPGVESYEAFQNLNDSWHLR